MKNRSFTAITLLALVILFCGQTSIYNGENIQSTFDIYLNALETETDRDVWQQKAGKYMSDILCQWEQAILFDGLPPGEIETARQEKEESLQKTLDEKYSIWLVDRFFSAEARVNFTSSQAPRAAYGPCVFSEPASPNPRNLAPGRLSKTKNSM